MKCSDDNALFLLNVVYYLLCLSLFLVECCLPLLFSLYSDDGHLNNALPVRHARHFPIQVEGFLVHANTVCSQPLFGENYPQSYLAWQTCLL